MAAEEEYTMAEERDLGRRGPDPTERPPDKSFIYAPVIARYAGTLVDVIFLHIILIPLRIPAADLTFSRQSLSPAVAFTVFYFAVLLLALRMRGLTPGGIPLKFRIVDEAMENLSWGRCLRRLAPHILIQLVALWHLHVSLQGFIASNEKYEFAPDAIRVILGDHGGWLNNFTRALNAFVIIDMLVLLRSTRNQSICDKIAGSFAVTKSR